MKAKMYFSVVFIIIACVIDLNSQQWQQFRNKSDSVEVLSMSSDNENVYIGTFKNGILYSDVNFANWQNINEGFNTFVQNIYSIAAGNNKIYSATTTGLFETSKVNKKWNVVEDGYLKSGYSLTGNVAIFPNNIFYSEYGALFKSENDGENWQLVGSGPEYRFISSIVTNGIDFFAGTMNGLILQSSDNGNNWNIIYQFPDDQISQLIFNEHNLIACTGSGLYSTNDFQNWGKIDNGVSGLFIKSILITSKNIFAATNQGVFISEKTDLNWTPVNDGLTNLNVNYLTQSGNFLFAAMSGGEVFKLDLSTVGVQETENTIDFSVSPNPATDFIEISICNSIDIGSSPNASVQIFNIYGIEVISTLSAAADTSQEGNLRIDVSGLSAGVYFIRIGDKIEKFVKM